MRASMFRSKFSIQLSISYDETYKKVAEIIIRSTKELRDSIFLLFNAKIQTNDELPLKYIAQLITTILFFNNAAIFSKRAAVSSLIMRLSTHPAVYVNEGITVFTVYS